MPAIRVAVIFDDRLRPETTGGYCERALRQFVNVQHFLPNEQVSLLRSRFDLYLRIDDGLEFSLPVNCRPVAWWAIDTHLDFDRCLSVARAVDLTFAAQRDGADALRRAGIAGAIWLPLACDPTVHRPHDLPKQHDVSFVGNVFPGPRSELLDLIRRRYHKVFVGNRYFEEMAKTYSASKLVFSDQMVIAPYGEATSLQFRVANQRSNVIAEVDARMLLMTVEQDARGELKRNFVELTLERKSVLFLALTWNIVHPIDQASPLWGKAREDLERMQAELLILIKGYDDSFSQVVHTRYSYRWDEIEWSARFVPAFGIAPGGYMQLDVGKISEIARV